MRFENWETRVLLLSSLLILDLGLVILLTRHSDVAYEQSSQDLDPNSESQKTSGGGSLEYLFCLPLKGEFDAFENRTEIELDDLNDVLLDLFQSEEFRKEREEKLKNYLESNSIRSELDYFQSSHAYNSLVLEQLRMSNYYVMNDNVCLVSREFSDFRYFAENVGKIFRNESLFVFKKETHDLYQMSSSKDKFDQAVVINREPPYSECGGDNGKNYTKNRCLNECFRSRFRLSRYFYDGNETGSIKLDWDEQDRSIKEHEQFCQDNCEEDSCKSTYFIPNQARYSKLTTYTAQPLITSFNFWLQLIGLFLPVAAIVLFQFSAKLFDSKAFRLILLFVCLLSAFTVFFALYRENYPSDDDDCEPKMPTKKEIAFRLFEPEPFSVVVCVGIGNIIQGDYNFLSVGHKSYSQDFRQEFKQRFYQNKTLMDLQLETQHGFDDTVEEVYLAFLGQKREVDWKLSPRVFFLEESSHTLSRCFQIDVNVQEPAYRSLAASSRLVIKFKHSQYLIGLLPTGTSPNNKNLRLESGFKSQKDRRLEKRLEGDCLDYREQTHCGSQQSCVEACMASELIDQFGKIPERSIIDRAHYDDDQWNSTQIEGTLELKRISKRIKSLCINKFANQADCYSTAFSRDEDEKGLQRRWGGQEISPYYDLVKEFVQIDPSSSSLLFSLLIVQGVFLVLNVLRLVAVVGFLKYKVRKIKLLHGLIYGGLLIGLFVHLIWAFRGAMNAQPILSQHYESPRSMAMNDAVFCFEPKLVDDISLLPMANMTTNHTANHTDADRTNLRLIIKEEEEEETENYTENENDETTTDAFLSFNATANLNDSNETNFRFNETENELSNYTDLAADYNATEAPFDDSNSLNETTEDYDHQSIDEPPIGMTGARLEDLTDELTPETVFDKISYLDKASGEWITLDAESNYTNADLHIERFFYEGNKCFALSTSFDYSRQQFAFLYQQNTDVLKVHLSEWFKQEQNLTLSIATKERYKMTFDNLFDGLYFYTKIEGRQYFNKVYSISQRELVQLTFADYFHWVNPLSFIFGGGSDPNSYFARLLDAFKEKHRSATLRLPLQENDFDLVINDTLFDQFYAEYVQANGPPIDREQPELKFTVNELEMNYKYPSPIAKHPEYDYDVKFSLSFLRKVIKQSNAGIYLQFVAYLLNALLVLVVVGIFDLFILRIS